MVQFTPRLSAPAANNKYWINTAFGGYNKCITINKSTGAVLPNCTGYAWGRFCEEANILDCKLARTNAENWYGNTADGYKRGKTPKLGAVICWRKGQAGVASDGAGHVGIVEVINDDSIVVSMSAYNGTRWYTRTFAKGSYSYNSLIFQGFIYNPYIIDEPSPKKSIDEIAQEVIDGKWGNGSARWTKLTNAGYTEAEQKQIQAKVNELMADKNALKVGDKIKIVKSGNSRPDGKGNTSYGINWIRYIKKIYKNSAYPYQVGNDTGITGYYKANALKKV